MYQKHIFVCLNHRDDGKRSCAGSGSSELFDSLKAGVKARGLDKRGIRVNRAGCLGQCEHGPCFVIYPEGKWVLDADAASVDEILNTYLSSE